MKARMLEIKAGESRTEGFIKGYGIVNLLRKCGFCKEKGIEVFTVIFYLITLVFTGRNLWRNIATNKTDMKKDTVYRFLNSPKTNWQRFLFMLAYKIYKYIRPLTNENRVDCLVLDDTLYDRSRSKNVELLARVFDHCEHKYRKGFRALTLGWTDGATFLPVGFNLMSSQKDENILCGINEKIDKRTSGYKARKTAVSNTLDVAENLLKDALEYKITAKYVLMDSWFSHGCFIKKIALLKLHAVAMLKDMEYQKYRCNGKDYRLSKLFCAVPKAEFTRNKNTYFATVTVEMIIDENTSVPIKITFVKAVGKKRLWLAIGSTDIEIGEEEIIRIYGKRWSIETFFKVAKSDLKLAKEFQSRSFDALVAHTTIVYVRYLILAVHHREDKDGRTVGELFFAVVDEISDIKLDESLKLIVESIPNFS